MKTESEYYLGIDWGRALCGIAIADSEMRIANAYLEVKTSEVLIKLAELRDEFSPAVIVVGKTEQEKYSDNAENTTRFVELLEREGYNIVLEEEFFSTKLAQANLAEVRSKGISKSDNAEAARVILQSWLDRNS